jgi:hypothetical protein
MQERLAFCVVVFTLAPASSAALFIAGPLVRGTGHRLLVPAGTSSTSEETDFYKVTSSSSCSAAAAVLPRTARANRNPARTAG